jgi:hypothetical protein
MVAGVGALVLTTTSCLVLPLCLQLLPLRLALEALEAHLSLIVQALTWLETTVATAVIPVLVHSYLRTVGRVDILRVGALGQVFMPLQQVEIWEMLFLGLLDLEVRLHLTKILGFRGRLAVPLAVPVASAAIVFLAGPVVLVVSTAVPVVEGVEATTTVR